MCPLLFFIDHTSAFCQEGDKDTVSVSWNLTKLRNKGAVWRCGMPTVLFTFVAVCSSFGCHCPVQQCLLLVFLCPCGGGLSTAHLHKPGVCTHSNASCVTTCHVPWKMMGGKWEGKHKLKSEFQKGSCEHFEMCKTHAMNISAGWTLLKRLWHEPWRFQWTAQEVWLFGRDIHPWQWETQACFWGHCRHLSVQTQLWDSPLWCSGAGFAIFPGLKSNNNETKQFWWMKQEQIQLLSADFWFWLVSMVLVSVSLGLNGLALGLNGLGFDFICGLIFITDWKWSWIWPCAQDCCLANWQIVLTSKSLNHFLWTDECVFQMHLCDWTFLAMHDQHFSRKFHKLRGFPEMTLLSACSWTANNIMDNCDHWLPHCAFSLDSCGHECACPCFVSLVLVLSNFQKQFQQWSQLTVTQQTNLNPKSHCSWVQFCHLIEHSMSHIPISLWGHWKASGAVHQQKCFSFLEPKSDSLSHTETIFGLHTLVWTVTQCADINFTSCLFCAITTKGSAWASSQNPMCVSFCWEWQSLDHPSGKIAKKFFGGCNCRGHLFFGFSVGAVGCFKWMASWMSLHGKQHFLFSQRNVIFWILLMVGLSQPHTHRGCPWNNLPPGFFHDCCAPPSLPTTATSNNKNVVQNAKSPKLRVLFFSESGHSWLFK